MTTRTRGSGRRSTGATRNRQPLFLGLTVLVLLTGIAILWLASRGGSGDDPNDAGGAGVPEGIAHVHGLGIDPSDGTLYAATHFGVFRVGDDGAQRVGPVQDTMGFTVVGDSHFLGSGHPGAEGMEQGQPPNLGLIESTDGAQTWQELSLAGEADFHALAYGHDQVYGWSSTSGELMVSTDMETWDTRSAVSLVGFAVDPADADRIVAATPDGVQISADGGRSWDTLRQAPLTVFLAWDPDSGLWSVGPDGSMHHAADPDAEWQPAGSLPGPPQALLVDGDTVYAAANHGDGHGPTGIYQSTDGGESWEPLYQDADL